MENLTIKSANPTWEQLGSGTLRWTESKTSLVELIHALASSGALNNGNCEIRELTALFEQAFNTRLPDIDIHDIEREFKATTDYLLDFSTISIHSSGIPKVGTAHTAPPNYTAISNVIILILNMEQP